MLYKQINKLTMQLFIINQGRKISNKSLNSRSLLMWSLWASAKVITLNSNNINRKLYLSTLHDCKDTFTISYFKFLFEIDGFNEQDLVITFIISLLRVFLSPFSSRLPEPLSKKINLAKNESMDNKVMFLFRQISLKAWTLGLDLF